MEKKCKICRNILSKKRRKFCSRKCNDRDFYLRHKEECHERKRSWVARNPERVKKINAKAMKKFLAKDGNRDRLNKRNLKDYHTNKEKWKARSTARYRVPIKKGDLCTKCGGTESLERHHPNYEQPTNVEILCRRCHMRHHTELKNI